MVIGGLKRIAKVSERVIPAMVVLYVGFSLVLIFTNLDKVPGAFAVIFQSAFGLQAAAGGMLGAIIVLFGFTTILGWDYYGERCLEYFSNGNMKAVKVYRWLYIFCVFIGPYMTVAAVWTIADIFNGLMALPNMIALIALSGVVVKETKDYFERLKAAGDEDAMEPHLPGDNWDIPPIDPLNAPDSDTAGARA